jgi:hypothetical protein
MSRIAYFITPHGYGHAARSAAVMSALHRKDPEILFDIYTHVPRLFFDDSLRGPFNYHSFLSDIGLAQLDSLHEDIPTTIQRLDAMLPFDPDLIENTASELIAHDTDLVICDIAPLGIQIAAAAGIPSILIENFTWDWIYQKYAETYPRMLHHAAYLQECVAHAQHHIQTAPICDPRSVDLTTQPVARKPRQKAETVRDQLEIAPESRMVLVSMGGFPERHNFVDRLQRMRDIVFVLPGSTDTLRRIGNAIALPHDSGFYHPDLVNAADSVIGKVGYSTLAEVYHCGVPFGYVNRPQFRESPPLADFIATHMSGTPISPAAFRSGDWLNSLPELLQLPRIRRTSQNGSEQISAFVRNLL